MRRRRGDLGHDLRCIIGPRTNVDAGPDIDPGPGINPGNNPGINPGNNPAPASTPAPAPSGDPHAVAVNDSTQSELAKVISFEPLRTED
ncbi:hypothetical protein [uncultured Ilumatobacter sp.]|uniref:hypothetical protein n=1 Tax=uncultured Ilumatobacter sp. TaxID=879968 RepID=UPI00374F728D